MATFLLHCTSTLIARRQTTSANSVLAEAIHAVLRLGRIRRNGAHRPAAASKRLGARGWVRPAARHENRKFGVCCLFALTKEPLVAAHLVEFDLL